ncbi:hypothetical protein [Streptomyces sp. URMC 125]|uniref:hypothetical protein n=1 Tax=Streptomyces sp. URMC 125 TaxID=3423419 RepID=UPI003F1D76C5
MVPFITGWSREPMVNPAPVRITGAGGSGLGYRGEDDTAYGRDWRGVLWARQALARGRGVPELHTVHVQRQRRAMSDLLCQVCGKTTVTGRPGERHLFLLKDVGRPIGEGERTTAPPVCVPCALIAVRECPHLVKGHVAAWVRDVVPWGVAGIVYSPRTVQPNPESGLVPAAYGDPYLRWVLAYRAVVALYGCTPVNLADLAA